MRFKIEDMTCNHCVMVITKAIKDIDTQASVQANIADRSFDIDSDLNAASLQLAIQAVGYTAIQVEVETEISLSR